MVDDEPADDDTTGVDETAEDDAVDDANGEDTAGEGAPDDAVSGWFRREAHPVERAVGIDGYVSGADGIGGRLRASPADFRVTELEAFDPVPLDADRGSYPDLVVRVTLRDWDTNDFARRISDALGISRERVSWAGTKDKRAVTTQLFTLRGVDPDDLPAIRGVDIDPLGRAGRGLTFGDLAGNAFEIRVAGTAAEAAARVADVTRDLRAFGGGRTAPDERDDGDVDPAGDGDPATDDDADPAADDDDATAGSLDDDSANEATLDEHLDDASIGVPNYFGQQRFGSKRPVTHRVGLAVVRGDWRGAVRLYAGNPSAAEPDDTRAARRRVDDAFGVDEGSADVDGSGDGDWGACLDAIPGKLRFERGMVHRLAEREADPAAPRDHEDWRRALEAVPSNLQRLFVNAAQSVLFNRILSERLRRGIPFDRPVAGDVACFADGEAPDALYAPDPDRLQRVTEGRVSVMERHCARDRAFVTAPLVGTETELGDGEPGGIERDVLAAAGVEPADFELPGEFGSTGTRRAILLRTDLDVAFDGGYPTFAFALPSGSYATVLLREFLKSGPLDL